jgi:NDP-sugar pyrophosphorylase family protein
MKAMILAAGIGTRLRPLTNSRPKALVEIKGRTLLEITLLRLRDCGVNDVIVNAHHFGDMIAEYLQANNNFGMRIAISREETLLDTGGGLKQAAWFFLEKFPVSSVQCPVGETGSSSPAQTGNRKPEAGDSFLLHNVDVLSDIDLQRTVRVHNESKALATLAVQKRESSRYLLFDEHLQLCGRQAGRNLEPEMVRPCRNPEPLAFAGIHVISPRLLTEMTETGAFSIIDAYLNLARKGESITAFRADAYRWMDVGKPESLRAAQQ